MIDIKPYNGSYKQKWDDFVRNSADGSLFHLTGWKEAVERTFGHRSHYLMALEGEEVRGVLPLIEVKSQLFGHSLVSVPYGVYGGIVADNAAACQLLEKHAQALAGRLRVDYLELRNCGNRTDPTDTAGSTWFSKDLYVTFRREILPTVDENMNAIPRKQRAMVRKGIGAGLVSRVGGIEDLERFYGVYARNVRDLGSPVYPLAFFRRLMESFPDAFILTVWKDDAIAAGVLTFVHGDTLLPYYGGGVRDYFDLAVNDFMYWELMRYGCEKGFKIFDFGRSKRDTGSFKFKKHWGFEPAQLDYRCHLVKAKEMPNVSPVNPKYELMIRAWKKLPLPVANWLGPKLVRGIP